MDIWILIPVLATSMCLLSCVHWALELRCFSVEVHISKVLSAVGPDLEGPETIFSRFRWIGLELGVLVTFSLNVRVQQSEAGGS